MDEAQKETLGLIPYLGSSVLSSYTPSFPVPPPHFFVERSRYNHSLVCIFTHLYCQFRAATALAEIAQTFSYRYR
jgi:hypothetical protein